MIEPPYAWLGNVEMFLKTSEETILRQLTRKIRERGAPQIFAWDKSWGVLRSELERNMTDVADFALILEFELPRSGGRRPDLIVLQNGTILVIEFKNRVEVESADIDQVKGYVRDLESYHSGCRGKLLVPVLVPIGTQKDSYERDGVRVVPPNGLGSIIRELAHPRRDSSPDAESWVQSPYEPLPALVEAARLLFERQPLPRIKQAESARIPEVVELVETAIRHALAAKRRCLVLLTGVPGSGKTLVGLQLVHSRTLGEPSVFLSGNGPLVQVLQNTLGSREFVQDMRSFLRHHLIRSREIPRERIVVFDEAQRAWDRERVLEKHEGQLTQSEPELLLRIAQRTTNGFGIVSLMGEGQEIHAGEESGIHPWVDAAGNSGDWQVLGPPHLGQAFRSAGVDYQEEPLLNLTTTLRSHRASDVANWVELLLQGRISEASAVVERLRAAGYTMYIDRDLERLRGYARDRYAGDPQKRYGVIASSKFRKIADYGVQTARHPYYYYGEWYNLSSTDPRSCCRMELAVSEFGCQGLELDMPLLCWGPDLAWDGSRWKAHVGKPRKVRDPERIRLNAYRVLLTRGRDGLLIFVPPAPADLMDPCYRALCAAGVLPLGQ